MIITLTFIGFILCIIQLIIFDWVSKNYTYAYNYFTFNKTRENSEPIKIKRKWYILYCIGMLIPIVNLFLFTSCTLIFLIGQFDYNYYYNGNNNIILTFIKYKNKIKYYLNTKV